MQHILDLFRSDIGAFWLSTVCFMMYWNLIWKIPGCVPFGANLTILGSNPNLSSLQHVLCSSPGTSCGGEFLGPGGVITSPNYPKNYGWDTTCVYVIKVDPNFRVQLTFEDFDTEECYDFCDGVKVRRSPDNCRGVRFGSEVGQIGAKWDKSVTYSDQIEKVLDLFHCAPIRPTLVTNLIFLIVGTFLCWVPA